VEKHLLPSEVITLGVIFFFFFCKLHFYQIGEICQYSYSKKKKKQPTIQNLSSTDKWPATVLLV